MYHTAKTSGSLVNDSSSIPIPYFSEICKPFIQFLSIFNFSFYLFISTFYIFPLSYFLPLGLDIATCLSAWIKLPVFLTSHSSNLPCSRRKVCFWALVAVFLLFFLYAFFSFPLRITDLSRVLKQLSTCILLYLLITCYIEFFFHKIILILFTLLK